MATLSQVLNQYKWGVVGVVVLAAVGGLIWAANRPVPEVAEQAVSGLAAPVEKAVEPLEGVAGAAPVTDVVEEPTAEVAEHSPVEGGEPAVVAESAPVVEGADVAEDPVAEGAAVAVEPPLVAEAAEVVAQPVPEPAAEAAEVVAEAAPVTGPAAEVAEATVEPAAVPSGAATAETPPVEVEVAASGAASATAPSLDLVRVEPGGAAIIAGTAEPNSEVEIKIDGETVATATASDKGEFVAFVETGEEPGAQAIQAVSADEVGIDLVSADTVLVLTPEAPEGEVVAPAVVSATEQAITVLQPGGLGVPDQVSLDSISYDKAGEAILAGRAQPLHEVRIYVDDVFAVSGQTTESGAWQIRLDQVAAGRYILRVDEIGPDGAVTSRAQTPFQKEYPENIAPFLQMANGKLTVQPGNTLWVMAREIYGSGIQYTQIFAANKDSIGDPDLIFPGQIFVIPEN